MAFQKQLPKKSEDLSGWYNALVLQAGLADYGPAKGTMIVRPYGYALWEAIQRELDPRIKKHGVENAYFPLFIPESLLKKEKEHVEGFSPELAVVTIGGNEPLAEPLVVRPTSETIMYDTFSRWIKSWRDLPLKINQWCNVVRWEKRTYLFLRTSEFLWQEGHTAHATHEEALATVEWAMEAYKKTFLDLCALPGYIGQKSDAEKFAGAVMTLAYEMMMPEGKALQSATSHDLGQNFSTSFDIQFQDKNGSTQHVWQTSWGLSTRTIGGLILVHGDDAGLRLPPRIAPIQVVLLPVRADTELLEACRDLEAALRHAGIRVKIDDGDDQTIGRKINHWELRGVPLRIEVGKRELESGSLKAVRRDNGEVVTIDVTNPMPLVQSTLDAIQSNLLSQAAALLREHTHDVTAYDAFKKIMETERGFLKCFWCGSPDCETKIKEETKATTRCRAEKGVSGACILCGKNATESWYFAQAY
jgi:prolyl-tRNA synthetase